MAALRRSHPRLGPQGQPQGRRPGQPAPRPTPWNAAYEEAASTANRNYLLAGQNLDLAQQRTESTYGLNNSDYMANPYSRAALLQQSYLAANRGTLNTAGNQIYAGSTTNRLNENRNRLSQGRDALEKSYLDTLGEINAKRSEAAAQKDTEISAAKQRQIEAAEKAPLEPEAAPAGRRNRNRRRRR